MDMNDTPIHQSRPSRLRRPLSSCKKATRLFRSLRSSSSTRRILKTPSILAACRRSAVSPADRLVLDQLGAALSAAEALIGSKSCFGVEWPLRGRPPCAIREARRSTSGRNPRSNRSGSLIAQSFIEASWPHERRLQPILDRLRLQCRRGSLRPRELLEPSAWIACEPPSHCCMSARPGISVTTSGIPRAQ